MPVNPKLEIARGNFREAMRYSAGKLRTGHCLNALACGLFVLTEGIILMNRDLTKMESDLKKFSS